MEKNKNCRNMKNSAHNQRKIIKINRKIKTQDKNTI